MRNLVTTNLTSKQIDEIRSRVRQGLAEIARGEAIDYEGREGLTRFFDEVRTEAHKKLLDKRRKKAKL
ncbi:MAG TPA: hypothetical protein VG488_01365 [Candidatus Angelobacter sp.]|jgi:hypothetical protein|nr:hypothetical protein [Candidatus Angelobacter sp.]